MLGNSRTIRAAHHERDVVLGDAHLAEAVHHPVLARHELLAALPGGEVEQEHAAAVGADAEGEPEQREQREGRGGEDAGVELRDGEEVGLGRRELGERAGRDLGVWLGVI